MTSPIYEDDELCKKLTEEGVAICGDNFLQIDRIHPDPKRHSEHQYAFLYPAGDAKILDLACGLGETAKRWLELDPSLRFTLNNISPYQLSQCPDLPKVYSDALETGLPDSEFHYVLIQYALGHLPHFSTLKECHRLLKPKGQIFIYDLFEDTKDNNLDKLFYKSLSIGKLLLLAKQTGFFVRHLRETPRQTLAWHESLGLTKEFMKNTTTFMLVLEKT
jgi:ubiquinone/menaquinone biosynthesis C-methylase UbiE